MQHFLSIFEPFFRIDFFQTIYIETYNKKKLSFFKSQFKVKLINYLPKLVVVPIHFLFTVHNFPAGVSWFADKSRNIPIIQI